MAVLSLVGSKPNRLMYFPIIFYPYEMASWKLLHHISAGNEIMASGFFLSKTNFDLKYLFSFFLCLISVEPICIILANALPPSPPLQ